MKSRPDRLASTVASALLAGPFDEATLAATLAQLRGRMVPTCSRIAEAAVQRFGRGRRPRALDLAAFLEASGPFRRIFGAADRSLERVPEPAMQPAAGAPSSWRLPSIPTPEALAQWLQVTPDELAAVTRPWRGDRERRDQRLLHYHYCWVPRRLAPPRLLEAPKQRLKAMQRRILTGMLDLVPAHAAAHGFVRGRSVSTFVAPHCAQRCLLRMDVQDFFASIGRARVLRTFLTAGYPEPVATLLAWLCTTTTPARVRSKGLDELPTAASCALRERLSRPHLPQGAPTSPTLANLCAHALDARLTGLARRFDATYTRYADDLLFSGGQAFARDAARCAVYIGAILLEQGLEAAHRKTRCMRTGTAQRAGGLVLNAHAAVPRRARERLEATLYNCVRHGPAGQNRDRHADFAAHLRGRIAHLAHVQPAAGAKLREIFARIHW